MYIAHYIIAFLVIVILENKQAFEIISSHDIVWSYINVTCRQIHQKDRPYLKEKELLDAYYDFSGSRLARSISKAQETLTKPSKQLESLPENRGKQGFNDVHYGTSTKSKDDGQIAETAHLDADTVKGSERVLLNTNCDTIIFKSGAVSDVVKSLFINTDGSLILNPGWFGANVTVLKVYAKSLHIPKDCSWLPPTVSQLDVAGSTTADFLMCRSDLKILSLVEVGLNETEFCFGDVESLDLSSNNLKAVDLSSECSSNVKRFKASHNKIEEWSSCTFPNLVYLSIDHNFVRKVDFSKCSNEKLFSLDVSHNNLSAFPTSLPEGLSRVILSFNKIENITAIESSFKTLDLSHNLIRRMVKEVFRLAWELSELNLSHNFLTVVHGNDFSGLRQLTILDLSHNKLQHIRQKAFSTLVNLKVLHLNGNNLHKLDTRLLAYLPERIKFLAHGNPWSCSCYLLAELSKITRATCSPKCHDKQNKLRCKQGRTWLPAPTILQRCLKAVQSNLEAGFEFPATPESDEDISEQKEEVSELAMNSGLILIVILILAALTAKAYAERKWLKRHLCNCLEPSSTQAVKNGNCLTSIEANSMHESESETEF